MMRKDFKHFKRNVEKREGNQQDCQKYHLIQPVLEITNLQDLR